MGKIFFRDVMLEITRRCQLKCAHCMRGDAQDLDMSDEIIDAFFEQVAGIGTLFFTGGEPTLAVDKMNYVLDQIIARQIPLGSVAYITNGIVFSGEIAQFLRRASDYVSYSREKYELFKYDCKIFFIPRIFIGLSLDNFHIQADRERVKAQYQSILNPETSYVDFVNNSAPVKVGRGEGLKYGFSKEYAGYGIAQYRSRIGIECAGNRLICDDSPRSKEMLKFCDAFVPCVIELSAIGKLAANGAFYGSYVADDSNTDNEICRYNEGVFPDLINAILEYNKGKKPCFLTTNIPKAFTSDDILAEQNFKSINEYDTENVLWPQHFDPIYADEIQNAADELSISIAAFGKNYETYLERRIPSYADMEEIRKDFPNSNKHFCERLHEMSIHDSVDAVIDWVNQNKNQIWYRVSDNLYELAKHIFRQRAINAVKDKMDTKQPYQNMISQILRQEFDF